MELVGRDSEKKLLEVAIKSPKSELIAVSGRRRIGKTFLIRETYTAHITFEITGLFNGGLKDQLLNFHKELSKRTNAKIPIAKSWFEAFEQLEHYISKKKKLKKKQVIFIDEFPWMATPRSKFLMSFENFWNAFATKQNNLVVVICGFAASYMVQKIMAKF